ncbi:MAG: hypothetical protein AAGB93_11905 [Planctomycetota bacterium]
MSAPAPPQARTARRLVAAAVSLALGWAAGMGVWIALFTLDRSGDGLDWSSLPSELVVMGAAQLVFMFPAALLFTTLHLRTPPPGLPAAPALFLGGIVGSVTMALWIAFLGGVDPLAGSILYGMVPLVVGVAGLVGATTFAAGAHFHHRELTDGIETREWLVEAE